MDSNDTNSLKRKNSDDSITDAFLAREKRAKVQQEPIDLEASLPVLFSQASDQSDVFLAEDFERNKSFSDGENCDSLVTCSNENVDSSNVDPPKTQNASQPNASQQTTSKEQTPSIRSTTSVDSSKSLLNMLHEIIDECKQSIQSIAHLTAEPDDDETLKDHLLPHKKSPLFTESEIVNKDRVQANVKQLIEESRRDSAELFTDEELSVFDSFGLLNSEAQQFFLLLMMKRDRWTFDESINSFRNFQTLRDELFKAGFLLDCLPENFSTLEEVLYLFDLKELNQLAKANKRPLQKTKTKMIQSLVLFARSSRSPLGDEDLEQSKMKEACKLLRKKGTFRINETKCKIIWKALLIIFAAPKFDKSVYGHFHGLL